MEKSGAISPEVKGLIERVKKQAQMYNESFEVFRHNQTQYERLVSALRNMHDKYKIELAEEGAKFRKNAETAVSMLKSENARTVKISLKLQDLIELQDKFEDINQRFVNAVKEAQDYIEHLENYIGEFRGRAENELVNTIHKINDQIEEKITKTAEKAEMKVALRQGQIEGNIISFDRKLRTLAERQKLDATHLANEVEQLKSQVLKLIDNSISGEGKDSAHDYISEIKFVVFDRLAAIETKMNVIEEEFQKPLEDVIDKSSDADNTKYRINQILGKLLNTDDKIKNQSNKTSASLTLGVLAIISSLIALLLAIFR